MRSDFLTEGQNGHVWADAVVQKAHYSAFTTSRLRRTPPFQGIGGELEAHYA